MRIGTSIALIVIGAILAFAVTADVSGLEISTIGIILIIGGVLGLLVTLLYDSMLRDRARRDGVTTRERVVERDPRF